MPSWFGADDPISIDEFLDLNAADKKEETAPKSAFDGWAGSAEPVSFEEALGGGVAFEDQDRPEAYSGQTVWNAFARASEGLASGLASARVGMGRLPSAVGLEAMSITDPDRYNEIKDDPDKLAKYQDSWEGIPIIGSINIDTVNDKLYNEFIAGSKEKVQKEYKRSKAAEAEDVPWYRNPSWWLEGATETAAQVGGVVGANVLLPGSGIPMIAASAGGSQFQEATERGVETLGAAVEGATIGILEGMLERIAIGKIMAKPGARSKLYKSAADYVTKNAPRFIGTGAAEATEEGAVELASIAMRLIEGDETLDMGDAATQVIQAVALGGAAGAGLGVPGTVVDYQRGKQKSVVEAARTERQGERVADWSAIADTTLQQVSATEEGRKKLETLSQNEAPTRKDFADAGFGSDVRFNAEERSQYAKSIPGKLTPVATQQAAEPPEPEITPDDVELKQVEEAVDETLKITGGKGVGNEKRMFGPKGYLARGFSAAKKRLGETSGTALTPEAKNLLKGEGDKKAVRGIKSAVGSAFEKFVNPKGSRKIIDRAVQDVAKFMKSEGGERFAAYYEQQAAEEEAVLRQRFPEIDSSTPQGQRQFQFYRMLNAIASAQTELSKNTEETMIAYDAIRSTGRVPVVFNEKGDPVYSFPKSDESRAEGPIYSDVSSVVDRSKLLVDKLRKEAPDDFEVLLGNKPIPEGLVQLDGKKKGEPVKTPKDFLYNYFAPKYITGEDEKAMNTTSSSLITKLVKEMATSDEASFRDRIRTAFEIGGGSSQYNKAFNYQVLNDLMGRPEFQTTDASGRNVPDMPKIVEWLNERVTPEELNTEKERLGYVKYGSVVMRDIIDTVWTAEGQEELIPRTFLFGPKVGAYMLNRMADADPRNPKYNTMDVWESRFWRYMNNDVPDTKSGIAEGLPRRVYMRQARDFAQAWEETQGTPMSVSAGQAARWYLMKEAAKKAGYGKAGENETIPFWTIKAIEKYMEGQLGQERGGEMTQTLAGVFEGQDLADFNRREQEKFEEREAAKPAKKTKKKTAGKKTPMLEGLDKEPPVQKSDLKKLQKGTTQVTTEEVGAVETKPLTPEEEAEASGIVVTTFDEEEKTSDDQGRQEKKPDTKDKEKARDKGEAAAEVRPSPSRGIATKAAEEKVVDTTEPSRRGVGTKAVAAAEGGTSTGGLTKLPGSPKSQPGPFTTAHEAKNRYLEKAGLPQRRQAEYVKVDEALATKIAEEYEKAEHKPTDPLVRESYDAMIKETLAQWQEIKATGLKVEFIKPGQANPYPEGPKQVHDDIRSGHMWVFPTDLGYGMDDKGRTDNPMLEKVGEKVGDHDMVANDVFRIVHDYFGHSLEGAGFGARGEENAWQAHVRMYSPLAARAMTAETRGQNSWVNYGPHGAANRANQKETVYAEQKITLLPEWVSNTNVAADQPDISTVSPYETQEVLRRKAMGIPDWRPKRDAKGQRTGKPISARAVVQNILARAGIVASEFKKETRPGVLGYYKWALSLSKLAGFKGGSSLHLRSSELADIGVATHEVAHFLDEKFNISGMRERLAKAGVTQPLTTMGPLTQLDPVTQALFRDLDYYTRQKGYQRPDKVVGLAEGWAEAVRLYAEADDINVALPAAVKSAMDSIMATNPELQKIISDTRVDVQSYLTQSDAEKVSMALHDMGRPVISPSESYFARQDRISWFRAVERMVNKHLANRIVVQERYEGTLRKRMKERFGDKADEAMLELNRRTGGNASYLMLNSQNLISRATDDAIENNVHDPADGTRIGTGFKNVFRDFTNRAQLDEFGRYMYSKTGLMRIELQADKGVEYIAGEVAPEVMQEYVNEIESGPNAQLYSKAMDDTTQYFNDLLELEVKYGLKTQAEVDAMKATHEIYMPFIRQLGVKDGGTGGKILGVKSSIRKLKGGSVMPVLDVYDAAVDRTNDVYSTVVRKIAEAQFIDQAELSGVAGDWVRRMTAEEAEGLDNVVMIRRGGVNVHYQIDPELKEALTQIGPGVSPIVAKILAVAGAPTALARKLMVNFNVPYFTPKNLARDLKTLEIRGLSDTTGFSSTGGMMSALALKKVASHTSQVDQIFDQMGGARGTKLLTSRTGAQNLKRRQKRRLFAEGMDRSAIETAVDIGAKGLQFTEAINDRIELAPRRAAFHTTLSELGKTQGSGFDVDSAGNVTGTIPLWAKNQAMFNAMEATTNFNRRGKWQPFIEPFFLFYNAAIQGTYGQFRTIGKAWESPKHAKRVGINLAVAAASKLAMLYAMSLIGDDEDEEMTMLDRYMELADYVKETSDVVGVKTPWGTSWVLIPKEREWGIISQAIDNMIVATIKKESITDTALKLGKRAVEQRIPFTGGVLPVAAQTFFNYDLFRGKEITGYWDKQKKPQYRYDNHTSTVAKAVGRYTGTIGIDPKKVDFIMRNTIGNLGPKLYGFATEDDNRKWSNVPIVGPFMTDDVPRQSVADFYLMREKAGQDFDEYVNNRSSLNESEVDGVLDNHQTVAVAEQIAKLLRESDLPQEDKDKYSTGVARWALDREPMSSYPNPLVEYEKLPLPIRKEVLTILKEARGPQRATYKAPKGSEKLREMIQAKRRIGLKLIKPPKE